MANRVQLLADAPPIDVWPAACTDALEERHKERFERLQRAIKLYAAGTPVVIVEERTGVCRVHLPRYLEKCLAAAPDGRIQGFRALLPFARTASYRRRKQELPKRREQQGGQSGLLSALLIRLPDVEQRLKNEIRQASKHKEVPPAKLRKTDLHRMFLQLIREQGVTAKEWPFTTKHLGKRSIDRYIEDLLSRSFGRSVHNWENQVAKAHLSVGTGKNCFLTFDEPYDAVEIDAYHIDAHLTVPFATPEGKMTELLLERLWLIAVVERSSSAVLAYTVVYRSEVAADDVVRVIRKAATEKWQPMELTVPGFQYARGAGLPSGVIEAANGAQWSVTFLDGALAHLARAIHERVRKTLGFVLSWGAVGHFERRPNVEYTFKRIAEDVFHRLPSTTGSNPQKGRARDAEGKALMHKIRAEHAEQLIDLYFAHHNVTPTEGQFSQSALEVLAYFFEGQDPMTTPRNLPQANTEAARTFACRELATIRGNRADGRRPYIQVERVHYTSPLLADCGHLIGKQVIVEIDEEDMRQVRVFLKNGQELGYLQAQGKWSITKHSRRTRRAINSLLYRRILVLSHINDPVLAYHAWLSTPTKQREKTQQPLTPKQATDATRIANEAEAPLKIAEPPKPPRTVSAHALVAKPSIIGLPMPDIGKVRNRK
jgi:putative transposase